MEKNYYAVIPASVRTDKKLTPGAKLLYGEVSALCNQKGYCFATNRYFASVYAVSQSTISRWISQLTSLGYIKKQAIYQKDSKHLLERRLYVTDGAMSKNEQPPHQKCEEGGCEIKRPPIRKSDADNSTSFNTTINKKGKDKPAFNKPLICEIEDYCSKRKNTIDAHVFYDFYESKGWVIGKNVMHDWKACLRTWENRQREKQRAPCDKSHTILANYTEADFARVLTNIDDEMG